LSAHFRSSEPRPTGSGKPEVVHDTAIQAESLRNLPDHYEKHPTRFS